MMYWVSSSKAESETGRESSAIVGSVSLEVDQGFDQRLVSLGFQCVVQQDDSDSIFENPVTVKYHQQNVTYAFANLLHALHVVQFHEWRSTCEPQEDESQVFKRPRK